MARTAIPTWFFVLVAVRLGHRFLMIQETKFEHLWYLPAGRVEPGEDFITAAKRETLEEAGIPIEIEGVLRVDHLYFEGEARLRVIFVARPSDDTPPKSVPDDDSVEAGWFTLEEICKKPLRGYEVLDICTYLHRGGFVAPLSIIAEEGTSFCVR